MLYTKSRSYNLLAQSVNTYGIWIDLLIVADGPAGSVYTHGDQDHKEYGQGQYWYTGDHDVNVFHVLFSYSF